MSSILNANVKGENILTIGVLIFILEKRTVYTSIELFYGKCLHMAA